MIVNLTKYFLGYFTGKIIAIIMKLMDLNIDCLEGILENLTFYDLVNAAISNDRFRHAVNLIYDRKYNNKNPIFTFDGEKISFTMNDAKPVVYEHKNGLELLRCFGQHITTMEYHFSKFDEKKIHHKMTKMNCILIEYIQKYCSETVTNFEINFDGISSQLSMFKKPFANVDNVSLRIEDQTKRDVHMTIDFVVRLFPNMQKLSIKMDWFQFIHRHNGDIGNLPRLEYLHISDLD